MAQHLIQKVIFYLKMGVFASHSPTEVTGHPPRSLRLRRLSSSDPPTGHSQTVPAVGPWWVSRLVPRNLRGEDGLLLQLFTRGGSGSGTPSDLDSRTVDTGLSTPCFWAAQATGHPRSRPLLARTFFLSSCREQRTISAHEEVYWKLGYSTHPHLAAPLWCHDVGL